MSGRRDYFYLQQVTDGELDSGFNELEKADRAMILALGMVGITTNLDVVQHGAGDGTVDISGLGQGHDKLGQFLNVPSNQNVDVSVDSNGQTTAISAFGLHRIVSVFLKFNRTLSDPRVDGNSDTVYFVRDESFTFLVIQGAESAGILTPPALQTDALLLADITRDFGVAAILNNHISYARREDAFVVTNTPRSIRAGTALGAMTQMLAFYANHVNGVADQHPAGSLTYLGSGPWADASTIAAGTVEATFDTMVATLASSSSGHSGAHLLGSDAIVGTANTLSAASIFTQLGRLKLASNHDYGGGGTWADGTTNPAASSEAQFDKIISDLASTTNGASGSYRLGSGSIIGVSSTIVAGTTFSQLTALKSAANLDQPARTTWLGGRTNPATRVDLAIDKIITDLASTTASDDGAERIGFAPSGNIAASDVGAAIRELDAEKATLANANVWTLVQTMNGGIIVNGSATINNTLNVTGAATFANMQITAGHYKLPTATSITRVQTGFWSTNAGNTWTPISSIFNTGPGSFDIGEHGEMMLMVPHGATITAISMWLSPGNHASIAGLSLPEIQFFKWSASGAAQTFIDQVTDPSANATAYSLKHIVTLSGLTEVVDRTNNLYYARLVVEQGANAQALVPPAVLVTYTLPNIDDGY